MNSEHELQLQKLYKLSRQQLSELVFFDDEVKFLKSLFDKKFLALLKDIHVNRAQMINSELYQLNMVKVNITADVLKHQGNLQSKIKNLLPKSIDFLQLENGRIEDEIKDLNKHFKKIKKEIFLIYKDITGAELAINSNTHPVKN
ncbi:hypothetical protein [Daejeonella oryzae]|uniref:hypothetical protein n=1 Tax=Daejeonella oryzae TaxID=1122943 RepID=UPI0005638B9B|nr:hypothetical protein [Daejeonella oryzae]